MYLLECVAAYLGVVLLGCVSCLEVGPIIIIFASLIGMEFVPFS